MLKNIKILVTFQTNLDLNFHELHFYNDFRVLDYENLDGFVFYIIQPKFIKSLFRIRKTIQQQLAGLGVDYYGIYYSWKS